MKRVTVGDIADVVSGGTPSRSNPEFWGGSIPWVKTGAIDYCWITEADEWITKEGLENSAARLLPKGTILMAMYGQGKTRGQVAILGIDATVNQACAALLLRDGCDRDFVYQQLVFRYASIRKMSNTGSQQNLNAEIVRNIAFPFPDELEQRKTAQVLTCWDRTIAKFEGLIGSKVQRKVGLMQQLLTGQRRFKEFKGKEWRRLRIGDLLQEVDRYVEFDEEHAYKLASVRRRSEGLFFREALQGKEIKTKVMKTIRTGDFLVSKMQVVHGAWGLVTSAFDGMFVSDSYIALVPREGSGLKIEFLNYLSQMRFMRHLAYVCSHGVHIEKMTFNLDDFLHEKITMPPTIEEQERIVGVLSACDQEINLLEKQLDVLKEQKRGLMQKLLTGEVRVKLEDRGQRAELPRKGAKCA